MYKGCPSLSLAVYTGGTPDNPVYIWCTSGVPPVYIAREWLWAGLAGWARSRFLRSGVWWGFSECRGGTRGARVSPSGLGWYEPAGWPESKATLSSNPSGSTRGWRVDDSWNGVRCLLACSCGRYRGIAADASEQQHREGMEVHESFHGVAIGLGGEGPCVLEWTEDAPSASTPD
jgi:hypothetical protein